MNYLHKQSVANSATGNWLKHPPSEYDYPREEENRLLYKRLDRQFKAFPKELVILISFENLMKATDLPGCALPAPARIYLISSKLHCSMIQDTFRVFSKDEEGEW